MKPIEKNLAPECSGIELTALDIAFGRFLAQRATLSAAEKKPFAQFVAQLSRQQNQGHNCIRLDDASRALVLASGLAKEAKDLETIPPVPLVVEGHRLYLHRYWCYEDRLARQITAMLVKPPLAEDQYHAVLARYFGQAEDVVDWQREAAKKAVSHSFCLITGGPGTGKTTTVVKILALLLELASHDLHIALAAPTGKAAMRLQEAIAYRTQDLPCDAVLKAKIPQTVSTLHRLLGARPPSPYFRHDAHNPLGHDIVVVDEASMVDLALMSKLVDALKPGAKLILLGDKDQLASVESGAVLADLSEALPEHTVELKQTHRFGGAIKTLSSAIREGQGEQAWRVLQADDEDTCRLLPGDPVGYIVEQNRHYLSSVKKRLDYQDIFAAHSRFQTLCANRLGRNSVVDINRRVEQALARQHLINPTEAWYAGRPVIILENAPALQLYNGDVGLCLPDDDRNGQLMVWFQRTDGGVKKYLPNRLPKCETVFAMTIHKSQGSEFDEVLVVLPDETNAVLSRELLYTAITRAKQSVKLSTDASVFHYTVNQSVDRVTGLGEKLLVATEPATASTE